MMMTVTDKETTVSLEIRNKAGVVLRYRGASLEEVEIVLGIGSMRNRNKISIRGDAIQLVRDVLNEVNEAYLDIPAGNPPRATRATASLTQGREEQVLTGAVIDDDD